MHKSKLTKIIILIILFSGSIISELTDCKSGCLMCAADEIVSLCQVCDQTKFFTNSGYDCKKTEFENCQETRDGLTCEICLKDFFLDKTTNKCVKVDKPITDCKIYETALLCKQCEERKYHNVKNGTCDPISKDIPNCIIYQTGTTCKVCDKSTLSEDTGSCLKINNSDNCAFFSGTLSCTACKPGYILFSNKYIVDMQKDSFFLKKFNENVINYTLDHNLIFPDKVNVCIKGLPNCVEYKENSFDECKVCETGYFLEETNNNCYKNPIQTVANCKVYETRQTCEVCKQGYYLLSSKCRKHSKITNCNLYSTITPDVCTECEDNYYFILASKQCIKRTKSIKKCAKYIYDEEKCLECQESFIISKDNKTCISQISKCQEYLFIPNADGSFSLLCKTCIPGFYILTKIISSKIHTTCELPSVLINGCYNYQSENQCVECRPGFYLANFKCHLHDQKILNELNCKDLSVFTLNDCSSCPESYYLYKLYNYCKVVPTDSLVENCNEYGTDSNCYKCNINYYLDNANNKCILSEITDCVEFDRTSNKCNNCDIKKKLMPSNNNVNNKCISIPEYMKTNCTDLKVDITGPVKCDECNADFYPFDLGHSFWSFCISQTELRDFREQYSENNGVFLNNCLSFDFQTKECLYCDPTSDKNYISSGNGMCIESCAADEIAYTFLLEGIYPKSFLKCRGKTNITNNTNIDNCARLDYSMTERPTGGLTEDKIIKSCVVCKKGFIGVIDDFLSFTYSHFENYPAAHLPNSTINKKSFFSITHNVPLITRCQVFQRTSTTNVVPYDRVQANQYSQNLSNINSTMMAVLGVAPYENYFNYCQYITKQIKNNNEYYGCTKCKFGTTGIVVQSHLPEMPEPYIHNCVAMEGCNTNVFYTGIGNYSDHIKLSYFISCSVCSNPAQIVTFPYGVKRWHIPENLTGEIFVSAQTNYSDFFDRDVGGPNTRKGVLKAMNSCEMKGLIETQESAFPNNCAVQVILTELKLWPYTIELELTPNPICVSCLPKFRPTISGVVALNRAFKYIISCEGITECKFSEEYNKCQECNEGFVLKYESSVTNSWKSKAEHCIINTLVGCLVGELEGKCYRCKDGYILNTGGTCDLVTQDGRCKEKTPIIKHNNAFDYLNDYPIRLGCKKCKEGFLPVRLNFNPKFCILNNAINGTTIGDLHSISNCLKYKYDTSGLICSNCLNGYYLTIDGKKCITERTSNCLLYQEQVVDYICTGCKDKYYLDSGKCYKGEIAGCLKYNNKENCVSCEGLLVATRINNNQFTICFDVDKSINNCMSNDLIEGFKGILKCTQCSNKSYPVFFDLAIKTCGKFFEIQNCMRYELSHSFDSSTFFCDECNPEYYTIKQFPSICSLRTNYPIENCKLYDKYTDKCENCIEGFFFENQICILNPSGIQGCRIYKNRNDCLECDSDHYIFENQCRELEPEEMINNCFNYNLDKTCQKCKKKFIINGNGCLENIIQNCEEYGFDKVCAKCTNEYAFFGETCQKINVSSCEKFIDANNCEICSSNYYIPPGTGRCFDVIPIANCQRYIDKDKCSLCDPGYIITLDQKKCLLLSEAQEMYKNDHCSVYEEINSCVVCDKGFYFNLETRNCVSCQVSNCAYCNYHDSSKCIMCMTGFYQTALKACVKDEAKVVEGGEEEKNESDYYLDLSVNVLEVFFVCFMIILV